MKGKILLLKMLLLATTLSVALAPAVFAAGVEAGATTNGRSRTTGTDGANQAGNQAATDQLIIKNQQGEELGVVVSFLVDPKIEKVAYALVDTGNSLAEEDLRLVPVNALTVENDEIILNVDKQQLVNAPIPAPGQEPMDFHRRIADYYGVAPYWEE